MRKTAMFIAMAIMAIACTAQSKDENGSSDDNGNNNQTSTKRYELFDDPTLDRGMALLAPQAVNGVGVPVDTLRFKDSNEGPLWHLCCWNFENGLSKGIRKDGTYGVTFDDGTYMIARDSKNVITMDIISSKAYNGEPRKNGENWINFLLETSFNGVELKKTKVLVFSYDLIIHKCNNKNGDAYNTNIHAAQCLAYLYVRNTNTQSKDYMSSLWLGVGSYDNRDEGGLSTIDQTQWDEGTSTYIFGMSDETVFGHVNFDDHKWHTCKVDVRKAINSAIKALTAKGVLKESQVDDFTVMGMNWGWELPGMFDVCSSVKNFSLVADVDLKNGK